MSLHNRLQNIKASNIYLKNNTFQANNNVFQNDKTKDMQFEMKKNVFKLRLSI